MRPWVALLAVAGAAAAQVPWVAAPYAVEPVAAPARVHGRLTLAGVAPAPEPVAVVADFACCAKTPKWSERLAVGDGGGVANAVVFLENVLAGKPFPDTTPTLDQRECVFRPHVLVAHAGRPLRLRNSDPVLHNVHAYMMRGSYEVFNVGMPPGAELTRDAPAPGAVALKCDAGHRWMKAYLFSAENPYVALTGPDGRFSIEGIPPGKRTVRLWHETLGELSVPLTLPASGAVELAVEGRLTPAPHWRRP